MSVPTGAAGSGRQVLVLPATRRDGLAIAALLERHRIACRVCSRAAEAAEEIGREIGVLLLSDQVVMHHGSHWVAQALSRQPAWSDLPVLLLSKAGSESPELSDWIGRMTNLTLLDRPTSSRTLLSAIEAALRSRGRQYLMRDQLLALQTAENELRQLDRRKDEFLAMLAHELRNPLAPIRTAIDALPRLISQNDPRTGATLGVVDRQVTQLTRLVDDLLDVSRITQGRIDIRRTPLDLAEVVRHAIESVEALTYEKRHTVKSSLAPGVFVEGDGARLAQCVSNILINAVKYTDIGGTITVSLGGDDRSAVLSVRDTGIGIPEELLPRVFELFVQDARSLDRSEGGLGIGLSVVRKLIQMHGGEVRASSAGPGQGATFEIVLPRIPTPPHRESPAPSPPPNASLRVLVVDDNQDAAESLSMLLSLDGHSVKTAYEPREALELSASFSPHLVLLDIGLPDIDGYEVARRMRSAGLAARLVALTGYGQREDVDRALAAGFDAHLVKPVEMSRLEEILGGIEPAPAG